VPSDIIDFSGDVSTDDLIKVFRAHGVKAEIISVQIESGKVEPHLKLGPKGDRIHSFPVEPVIYSGKAHWLARMFGVPLPDLYQPDKFTSAKALP
jgi:hypothetical protein